MLTVQLSNKRNGKRLPRSMAVKLNRQQTIQKVQLSRYTAKMNIDAYEDIPQDYPESVKLRSPIKEVIFADDALVIVSVFSPTFLFHLICWFIIQNCFGSCTGVLFIQWKINIKS